MGERNRQTVAAYDGYAAQYAEATQQSEYGFGAVERFVRAVGEGGRVLEVASGPGWDADEMEAAGLTVRRTDLSEGFIAVQAERGKVVERLDLIADDLGAGWDGIVALYVLQHIEPDRLEGVVAKLAGALKPGGHLLTSFQEGAGEVVQHGADGDYHVFQRAPDEMMAMLEQQGLTVEWKHSFDGDEARWTILIARSA